MRVPKGKVFRFETVDIPESWFAWSKFHPQTKVFISEQHIVFGAKAIGRLIARILRVGAVKMTLLCQTTISGYLLPLQLVAF